MQEQFGFVAQGDVNAGYTSGVGVRTATQLLVFNGYAGPAPTGVDASAADGGSVNLVYVQAFDPATAKSLGPPALLFQAPDGAGFTLMDVSIAPSGQIALAFSYYGGLLYNSLSAAFLAPGTTGSLNLGHIAQIESARIYGQPHVIWSVASQAFLFSWENVSSSSLVFTTKVAQILPDGRPGSGASGTVPTDSAGGMVYSAANNIFAGAAGTSASLVGVGFESGGNNGALPFLTILDSTGGQVGSSLQLSSAASRWIAVAGTSLGFVTFFDNGTGVSEAFVAVSADAGVAGASSDGGDAGALPGFVLPGAADALDGRALSDDQGGPGGVGAALLYPTQVGFAYVNPNGQGPLAHFNAVLPHTYATGDFMTISNYRGLFAVSLYDSTKHSTQVIASGCQ
jgi:hypothetical protein